MKPSAATGDVFAEQADAPRLWMSGYIRLGNSGIQIVHREMLLCAQDGQPLGTVAALVIDPHTGETTHLLMGCWRSRIEYRLVALELIDQVNGENIQLGINCQGVEELPRWEASDSH